jgi:hypothetical protein
MICTVMEVYTEGPVPRKSCNSAVNYCQFHLLVYSACSQTCDISQITYGVCDLYRLSELVQAAPPAIHTFPLPDWYVYDQQLFSLTRFSVRVTTQ